MGDINVQHPRAARRGPAPAPGMAEIEKTIRTAPRICCAPIPKTVSLPTHAAFNLLGDADIGGREMVMALTGLNSRGYKNSTLPSSLARIFIAHSRPAR